jgi:holo-[acyl-carrier protein] synthase
MQGIGIDIVNIKRIKKMLKRHPTRALTKILSLEEQQQFATYEKKSSKKSIAYLAKRFAAKEAVVKALGLGFRKGLRMRDISILNDDLGKPIVFWSDEAKVILARQDILISTHIWHVAISDEKKHAVAVATYSISAF